MRRQASDLLKQRNGLSDICPARLVGSNEDLNKKIDILDIPEDVEISDLLIPDEMPVIRDKNLKKTKKIETPSGAFHEKKAKNSKVQLGGKRRQEKQRRKLELSRSKRNR